ncbi:MAG TPA: hypothetical protein VGC04_05910, partial [Cellulomonas sp.]
RYQARAIEDLAVWLAEQGTWVPLGAADEQKPAAEGTVEAWGRSESNPGTAPTVGVPPVGERVTSGTCAAAAAGGRA